MIEKKLTWAVVLALVLQLSAGLMWAGGAAERIRAVESELDARRPIIVQTAAIQAELQHLRAQLSRIENKLDQRHD